MIAKDKRLHFAAGAIISCAVLLITNNPFWSLAAGTATGVAKEAYDATGRGNVELWDFLWTFFGALLVFCVAYGVQL